MNKKLEDRIDNSNKEDKVPRYKIKKLSKLI